MRVLAWLTLLAAALVLRALCLGADFWLDEILSFDLSREITSPLSVFSLRSDNNHPLNTLWLSLWAADAPPWCLRLHSLAAGVLAVFLTGVAGRRVNAETPALVLGAGCWWLVLASADARGYALAVAAALAAFLALDSYLARPRWSVLVGFWAAVLMAFLSHLTFLHAYLGMIVWSARGGGGRDQLRRLAVLHAVPGVFLGTLYLGFLRGLQAEGGPPAEVGRTLVSLLSRGLGGPSGGWVAAPFVLAAVGLFAAGLASLMRRGDSAWAFFLVASVLAPGLALLLRPPFLFERYFLISFTFAMVVIARGLADLRPPWRLAALLVFAVGSVRTVLDYAETGRGHLRAVVNQLRAEGGRVAGDHDFRVGRSLRFHAPDVPYVPADSLPQDGVEWLLVHRLDRDERRDPGDEETDRHGNAYAWAASYPAAGPAGWGWFLFRRKVVPPR